MRLIHLNSYGKCVQIKQIADCYGTFLTAAALRWISSTPERAMFVLLHDGFVQLLAVIAIL